VDNFRIPDNSGVIRNLERELPPYVTSHAFIEKPVVAIKLPTRTGRGASTIQDHICYTWPAMCSAVVRLVMVTFLAGMLHAAPAPMSLKWNELSGEILNKNVVVDLKDGSSVKAVVASVQPTGLAVNVSSNSHSTYKKGEGAIPREQISRLRLTKQRKRGRIIGTTTGVVLGLLVGSMVGIAGSGAGAVGVMASAPVAGYFIGLSTDRQERVITILPD
jgi:hypothetical protein